MSHSSAPRSDVKTPAPPPGHRPLILAIDLGTSGPKVALVAADGTVVISDFETVPVQYFPGGGCEQHPEDWWSACCKVSRKILRESGLPPEVVVGVCASAHWSSTVAVDRSGKPLHPCLMWMDTRGAQCIQEQFGGFPSIQGYRADKLLKWLYYTGGMPTRSGKDSLAHILWLKRFRPEVYREAHKFLEPKDWLNVKMTGIFASAIDSIILTWITDNRNIDHIHYHDGLLRDVGIDRDKLPDLLRAVDVVGALTPDAALELGVPAGIPVVSGMPDTHAAAIGAGSVTDFETHLYLGTSSWMICHVPFKKTDIDTNMASMPSSIPGRYILLNDQECAGVCLSWLRNNLFFPEDELNTVGMPQGVYGAFDRLAASVPAGANGLIFTPWLYGERTPIEDPHVRGGFFNLTLQSTRAELARAVLEGVALNSRWLMQGVEKFIGRRLPHIRAIGGGSRSDVWCQIYADCLGRPIHQVEDPLSANARGAGLLGAVGCGLTRFEDISQQIKVAKVFTPDPKAVSVYDQKFSHFVALYRANKALYARLNPHVGHA